MNGAILRGPTQTESIISIASPLGVTLVARMLPAFSTIGAGFAIYLLLATDDGPDGTTAILVMSEAISQLRVIVAVGIQRAQIGSGFSSFALPRWMSSSA